MKPHGPWMAELRKYVDADIGMIDALITKWSEGRDTFRDAGTTLTDSAVAAEDGFSSSSMSGQAARRNMEQAGTETDTKYEKLKRAVAAMEDFRGTVAAAKREYARLEHDLPDTVMAPPDPSDPKYASQGGGTDTAQAVENQKALKADRAAQAANAAAFADAERIAAQHVQDVDVASAEAEPPVRALFEDPDATEPMPPATTAQPGSYSAIAASRARMAKYNSGTMYPEGWGHELIAQERENIKIAEAENRPEWDSKNGQWVNFDGTPTPATSYAMVETADGLAPTAGGAGGAAALAVGAGGALLGAGVAKAVANKFGATRAAGSPSSNATAKTASARSATAGRTATAGSNATRGAGAGARGAGAGGRAAGKGGLTGAGSRSGAAGAGSRTGAGGRGGAAGGRGAGKKDRKNGSQDQDYLANTDPDWVDPDYQMIDPEADKRNWTSYDPKTQNPDGTPK